MSTSLLLLLVAIIGVIGYVVGSRRASVLANGKSSQSALASGLLRRPCRHLATLPAILVMIVWKIAAPTYINSTVRGEFPAEVQAQPAATQNLAYAA